MSNAWRETEVGWTRTHGGHVLEVQLDHRGFVHWRVRVGPRVEASGSIDGVMFHADGVERAEVFRLARQAADAAAARLDAPTP